MTFQINVVPKCHVLFVYVHSLPLAVNLRGRNALNLISTNAVLQSFQIIHAIEYFIKITENISDNCLHTPFTHKDGHLRNVKWTIIFALQNMFPPRTLVMLYTKGGGN